MSGENRPGEPAPLTRLEARRSRAFLDGCSHEGLRRALRLLRRQASHPGEINPAAAQYDGIATVAQVRAAYRRRGWKLPQITRWERAE